MTMIEYSEKYISRLIKEYKENGGKKMLTPKILIACEESQAVTIELRRLGHEAYSCDIIPCSGGPLTNADRIRAMSDDELAKFLATKLNDDFYGCPDLILQWLQQPAEEEQT